MKMIHYLLEGFFYMVKGVILGMIFERFCLERLSLTMLDNSRCDFLLNILFIIYFCHEIYINGIRPIFWNATLLSPTVLAVILIFPFFSNLKEYMVNTIFVQGPSWKQTFMMSVYQHLSVQRHADENFLHKAVLESCCFMQQYLVVCVSKFFI